MTSLKKIFFTFVLLLCNVILIAQDLPTRANPPRLVNDYTGTLTYEQAQTLENKLVALDDATSSQIAVVIIETLNGTSISEYNLALLRKWGVGNKKNNNGVILLITKKEKKLDITVGYGLQGALTDATAKSIIDDVIVPKFKGNDYYRGIDEGTDAIIKAVQGQYKDKREKGSRGGGSGSFMFIFLIIIIFLILSSRGGGKGGGTFMSRRGQRGIADAIFWNTILNSGGRGGGWSGGDSGGGFSGGGGFGGFGGGSGDGGGASGSW
jgi:uncharacterized protein